MLKTKELYGLFSIFRPIFLEGAKKLGRFWPTSFGFKFSEYQFESKKTKEDYLFGTKILPWKWVISIICPLCSHLVTLWHCDIVTHLTKSWASPCLSSTLAELMFTTSDPFELIIIIYAMMMQWWWYCKIDLETRINLSRRETSLTLLAGGWVASLFFLIIII